MPYYQVRQCESQGQEPGAIVRDARQAAKNLWPRGYPATCIHGQQICRHNAWHVYTTPLLETWVLHELRAVIAIRNAGGQLHYWRTSWGSEVDFVWIRGSRAVGIEVKTASTWRREHGAALKQLMADGVVKSGHGVYTGSVTLKDGPLHVWPLDRFFTELTAGGILE